MYAALHIAIGLMILLGVGIIVFSRSVIHAAYALGLALVGISGVYVLVGSELLAVVQILLYAGGVIILLVFGVMMTNRLRGDNILSESKNQVVGGLIALSVFSLMVFLISNFDFQQRSSSVSADQIKQIGVSFLTEHIVAFELIAFVLLVALVGAAYLAKMSADE